MQQTGFTVLELPVRRDACIIRVVAAAMVLLLFII